MSSWAAACCVAALQRLTCWLPFLFCWASGDSSSSFWRLCFVLRFWNQTFTWGGGGGQRGHHNTSESHLRNEEDTEVCLPGHKDMHCLSLSLSLSLSFCLNVCIFIIYVFKGTVSFIHRTFIQVKMIIIASLTVFYCCYTVTSSLSTSATVPAVLWLLSVLLQSISGTGSNRYC